jgi:hypothetical protein
MSDTTTPGVEISPNGPTVDALTDALRRIEQRIDHLDRVAARLEELTNQVPPMIAVATDWFDEVSRRAANQGIDLEQRGERLAELLERLTASDTFPALRKLLERVDQLDALLTKLDEAPALLATVADIADEWADRLHAEGFDMERSVEQGLRAALWLGERISENELNRLGILLRSDVLEPHALAVVGKTGRALATCHEEHACDAKVPDQIGLVGLLRAFNDPDIRRALGFLVRVGKCFGHSLPHPHDAVS